MSGKTIIAPENVCADRIWVETENGVIVSVEFEGGCDGNGKALGRLLAGMPVTRAVKLLSGVDCEGKGTSCADQLARGLSAQAPGSAET
ncbi:MAG: TIGR03905 family TSCPD domain-containing protein [Planctomycetes bacterium]|nr:TIGR03905 family TSCPD domain-containing protein [Planctomycetota bacterium]